MSNNRMVMIGGVSVGLWWLFFTCKGRELLNRALRAVGRPEVKPCCTGCSDHVEPAATVTPPTGGGIAIPAPAPALPISYGATFTPEPSPTVVPMLPSVGIVGLVPPPGGSYAPMLSSAASPPPPPPREDSVLDKPASVIECVEPACRPYVAPVPYVDLKEPAAPVPYVDPGLKPPSSEPVVRYDGVSGTVGLLDSARESLRLATAPLAPSFLKPAPVLSSMTLYTPPPVPVPTMTAALYTPPPVPAPTTTATLYTAPAPTTATLLLSAFKTLSTPKVTTEVPR